MIYDCFALLRYCFRFYNQLREDIYVQIFIFFEKMLKSRMTMKSSFCLHTQIEDGVK